MSCASRLRFLAIIGASASLVSCAPAALTAAGVFVDVGLHTYELATRVSGGLSQGIEIECRALIEREAELKASGKQSEVDQVEKWSGARAFCDPTNPPPADPIAAAFWIGTVIARL